MTTDANGNLASDGGNIIGQIGKNTAGVAIAIASQAPDLAGSENFGMRLNYANFNGDGHAVSLNGAGVLGRDVFSEGDRVTLDVGAGWGKGDRIDGLTEDVFAVRAGIQLTW